MGGVKILVDTEDVPQKGDVLGQQGTPEGVGRVRVIRLAAIVPVPGFQQIDADPAAEQIHEAAPQVAAQILHLVLRIQGDNGLAGLQHITQQEFQQVALALPAVAQDQGAGVGLVAGSPVQVHDDIGAIFFITQVEAAGIRLARVAHGVEICHTGGGQDALGKGAKDVMARRIGGEEAVPLPQEQRIRPQLGTEQHGIDLIPQGAQL